MYQMSQSNEIFTRLFKEGEIKKYNYAKLDEIRERMNMMECTFTPRLVSLSP